MSSHPFPFNRCSSELGELLDADVVILGGVTCYILLDMREDSVPVIKALGSLLGGEIFKGGEAI